MRGRQDEDRRKKEHSQQDRMLGNSFVVEGYVCLLPTIREDNRRVKSDSARHLGSEKREMIVSILNTIKLSSETDQCNYDKKSSSRPVLVIDVGRFISKNI